MDLHMNSLETLILCTRDGAFLCRLQSIGVAPRRPGLVLKLLAQGSYLVAFRPSRPHARPFFLLRLLTPGGIHSCHASYCRQLLFDNTFHLGTGVMFPEFMLYNFDMEHDERVVDIKARHLP